MTAQKKTPRVLCAASEIAAAYGAMNAERARLEALNPEDHTREADAILANPPEFDRAAFLLYAATDQYLTFCIRERERSQGSAEVFLEPLFNSEVLENSVALFAYRAVLVAKRNLSASGRN